MWRDVIPEFCAVPPWVSTRSSEGMMLTPIGHPRAKRGARGQPCLTPLSSLISFKKAPFTWIKEDFAGDSVQTRGLFRRAGSFFLHDPSKTPSGVLIPLLLCIRVFFKLKYSKAVIHNRWRSELGVFERFPAFFLDHLEVFLLLEGFADIHQHTGLQEFGSTSGSSTHIVAAQGAHTSSTGCFPRFQELPVVLLDVED
ncbi:hypothetical protein R1flu_013970 [Riccia fluitans]|uniref:Uncharacterized protein n=1 Tax=Riccia fluitans TaxID=41844 RepID=A0ABD1YES2_9MARC